MISIYISIRLCMLPGKKVSILVSKSFGNGSFSPFGMEVSLTPAPFM